MILYISSRDLSRGFAIFFNFSFFIRLAAFFLYRKREKPKEGQKPCALQASFLFLDTSGSDASEPEVFGCWEGLRKMRGKRGNGGKEKEKKGANRTGTSFCLPSLGQRQGEDGIEPCDAVLLGIAAEKEGILGREEGNGAALSLFGGIEGGGVGSRFF